MDVDMAGFAAMQDARNHFAIFIFNVDKNGWANCIQIPHIMSDILEMADVFTGVQINGNKRVGVEVVARTNGTIQIGRWVSGDKENSVSC